MDFGQYLKLLGSNDLSEILEASAAYLSIAEGYETFSRPQVVNTLKSAMADKIAKADSLSSFGQLLRKGKIKRVGEGQFQLEAQSPYMLGEAAAG